MKKIHVFDVDEGYTSTKEINNNYYIVVACPLHVHNREYRQLVLVYHSPSEPTVVPDTEFSIRQKFDKEVQNIVTASYKDEIPPLESQISEAVNEAVCKVENRQDHENDMLQRVEAALEANKEVHEGIDYQLR